MSDLIGQSLGPYHILEQLGAPCGDASRRVGWRLSTKPMLMPAKQKACDDSFLIRSSETNHD